MHLSHEISRRGVRTMWGFEDPVPQLTRHTDAKHKNSTKRAGRRTDSCSWCGPACEKYVSGKPCSSRAVVNERKTVCVVLCKQCVGQLLLLARFTRTARWLHGTVTPCPRVPISLSHTNATYDITAHSPRQQQKHTHVMRDQAPFNIQHWVKK